MPQPPVRNPFTSNEEKKLQQYLAKYYPDDSVRMGESIYERLVRNEDGKWPWSKTHTAHSWRNKYKANKVQYDIKINEYIKYWRKKDGKPVDAKGGVRSTETRLRDDSETEDDEERATGPSKIKPTAKRPASSTTTSNGIPPPRERQSSRVPSTPTPKKLPHKSKAKAMEPKNSLATPESSSFGDDEPAPKPVEKGRKRKTTDDEAGPRTHAATTATSMNDDEGDAPSRKKVRLSDDDTNRDGRTAASEMDFGDEEMEARSSRHRDHPSYLKISDEKLREMYNERFGAPAVQEQGVAKRTQIDEKRTEANLTKTVPDRGEGPSNAAAVSNNRDRLYPEITEDDRDVITTKRMSPDSDNSDDVDELNDGDDLGVDDVGIDADAPSFPTVRLMSSEDMVPPTSQPEEDFSDDEKSTKRPVNRHDTKRTIEDDMFGTPPPEGAAQAVDNAATTSKLAAAAGTSSKASSRPLPKFQDSGFREGAFASSRRRSYQVRQADSDDSETEAMSDASDPGGPTPRRSNRAAPAQIAVWPPQRKPSVSERGPPPSSSLASRADVSFRPSQVASASTPKKTAAIMSSKDASSNAAPTSTILEGLTKDSTDSPRQFLVPQSTRAVSREKEGNASTTMDVSMVADDSSRADRQVTPATSTDSVPNLDPFLTSVDARRIRKETKGKGKELPTSNVVLSRAERRRTFAGFRSSPLLDLRKHALRGSVGFRSASTSVRRSTSSDSQMRSQGNGPLALDSGTVTPTLAALFPFIDVDLTVDILSDVTISPNDTRLFMRAGMQFIFGAMAKNHGFNEEWVKKVYREYGDLKGADRALVEMKNGVNKIFAEGVERRRSTSNGPGEPALSSSRSSSEHFSNGDRPQRSEGSRYPSRELDLADISRRSSTGKRPRNSLNFIPAAEDPNYSKILDGYGPPSASRAARKIRHKRVSSIGTGSPLKNGDHGSPRENGDYAGDRNAISGHRAEASAIGIIVSDEEKDASMQEEADSTGEEAEVFASLTPAPPGHARYSLEMPNGVHASRDTVSPLPPRTAMQTRTASNKEQQGKASPDKVLPVPPTRVTTPLKQKTKLKKTPPPWTAEEDRILRSNDEGPKYDEIVKRRGRTAVKLRQTELNEEDLCYSD